MPRWTQVTGDELALEDFRHITDSRLLDANLFVAEGRTVVRRLLESRPSAVRSMLLSEASARALTDATPVLPDDVPIYVAPIDAFQRLTGFNLHRGCLALVERPPQRSCMELARTAKTLVLLESVGNADNVGGVFRNAAAFGVDAVLLSPGTCDPLYRKAIRTSMGASLAVPFSRADDWPAVVDQLGDVGFMTVALTPHPSATSLDTFLTRIYPGVRTALLLGAEGPGLTDEVMQLADVRARIPTTGAVDSLNLAVAAGIVLSALFARSHED